MAVVQGQGQRRRQGVAPNTLVMAQSGQAEGTKPYEAPCRVGRCKESFTDGPDGTPAVARMRMHEMLAHPRHSAGKQSREIMMNYFNGGP